MTRQTATVPQADVPGPSGMPLLGSALDLRRDLLATFEQAHRRYGDVVRLSAGSTRVADRDVRGVLA
jgi:hypothetical protein